VTWSVKVTEEYAAWFTALMKDDLASAVQVAQAVAALREEGPALGRPLVDRIQGSRIHHLKELRHGSAARSEIRVLFAFDPHPLRAAAPRRRQGRELETVVQGEHPDRRAVVPGLHHSSRGIARHA
jgi:hypothetical protein